MGLSAKTEFVGSFLDTEYVKGEEKHVFASISGPYGTRIKLAQVIVPVLEELETKGIVSLGMPGKKISVKRGNCEMYGWLSSQERQECMKNAELVIFSGGHRTCFETIKYAKPSICVPTQPEQMGNAKKLQKLNCSISVKNRHELKIAIQRISKEYQYFKKNITKLSSFTRKFKGLRRSVEIIENSAE
jgi:UDP:flavonoid glycosyltransferase YjiC (YdhE family)